MENEEIKQEMLHRFEMLVDKYLKVKDEEIENLNKKYGLSKKHLYDHLFIALTTYTEEEIKKVL